MSKICPSCGRESEEDVQFCPFCAAFIGTTGQEEISAPHISAKSIIIVTVLLAALAGTALALFVFDFFGLNDKDDVTNIGGGRPLFAMGLSPVSRNGMWGYINKQGEFEIDPAYSAVLSFNDDLNALAGAAVDGSFGFINVDGDFAVAANYRIIADFAPNGIALAYTEEDGYFYINSSGRRMFDRTFADADGFNDSGYAVASVFVDGVLTDTVIASDGSTVFSSRDNLTLGELHGEFFTARYDYGDRIAYRLYSCDVIDMVDATAPYPGEYDRIAFYNDLVLFFTLSDKAGFYEVTVARLNGSVYDELRGGLYADYNYIPSVQGLILYEEDGGSLVKAVFSEDMNRLYSEKDGGEIISAPDKSGIFCVKENGKYAAYNAEGKLFECEYPFGIFNCGLAPYLSENMQIGYMNVSGETVIPPQYSYATDFSADGYAYVLGDSSYAIIDTDGNVIIDGLDYSYPDAYYSDTDLTGYTFRSFDGHKDDVNLFVNGRVEVCLNDEEVPELGVYGENHLYSTDGKPLYSLSDYWYTGSDGFTVYLMKRDYDYETETGVYTISPGSSLPQASRLEYPGTVTKAGIYKNETYPLSRMFDNGMYDAYLNMAFRPLDVTRSDRGLQAENVSSMANVMYYEAGEMFVVVYWSDNYYEDHNTYVRIYDKKLNRLGGYTVHTDSNGVFAFSSADDGILLFPAEDGEDYIVYEAVDVLTGRVQNSIETYDSPAEFSEDFIFMDHGFGSSKYDPTNRKAVSRIGVEINGVTYAGKSYNYVGSGLINVKLSYGSYGYADIYGTVYGDYERITAFNDDGYAAVQKDDGKYYCIDAEFNELFSSEYEFLAPHSGYALYYDVESGRLGYLDMDGNIAQTAIYDTATDFYSDGYAAVRDGETGKLLVIDRDFNTVMTAEDINADGSVTNIGEWEHHTAYDFYGVKEHYEKYARMNEGDLFECGLIFNGMTGYDKYGNYVLFNKGGSLILYAYSNGMVSEEYDSTYMSGSIRVIAELSDGSYGIIVSVPEYDSTGVGRYNKYGIIDLNGEFIVPPEYDSITVTGSGDLLVTKYPSDDVISISSTLTSTQKVIRPDGSEIKLEYAGDTLVYIYDLGGCYRVSSVNSQTGIMYATLCSYDGKELYWTQTEGVEPDYYGMDSDGRYISFVSNQCIGYLIDTVTGETVMLKEDCVGVMMNKPQYGESTAIAAGFVTYAGNDLWHYAGYIIDDGEILYEDEGTEYNFIALCNDELAIVGNLNDDSYRVLNYRTGEMTEQEFYIFDFIDLVTDTDDIRDYLDYNGISDAVLICDEIYDNSGKDYYECTAEYYTVDAELNVTTLGELSRRDIKDTAYTGGVHIVPINVGVGRLACLVCEDSDGNRLDGEYERMSRFTADGYSVTSEYNTDKYIVINTDGEKVFALDSYDLMSYGSDILKFYTVMEGIGAEDSHLVREWYTYDDVIVPANMLNSDLMINYTHNGIKDNIRFDNYIINESISDEY